MSLREIAPEDDSSSAFEQGISREGQTIQEKRGSAIMYRRAPVSFGVVSHRFHDLLFDREFQRTLPSKPSEGGAATNAEAGGFSSREIGSPNSAKPLS